MARIASITCLAALVLAGCAVGPAYERPAVETPARWIAAPADDRWPAPEWWKDFGDARLNELVRETLARNHDLQAAAERIAQAQSLLQVAEATGYPALSVQAEASRARGTGNGPVTNRFGIGLAAAFDPDLFGFNRGQTDAAAANLRGSQFDRQAFALGLTAATAMTYFELAALDARLAVAQETLAGARRTLELIRMRQTAGMAGLLPLAQQEAEIAALEAVVPALETGRRQAAHALALLLGQLPERLQVEPTPIVQLRAPQIPAGLPSALLERRPDVARAEAMLVAANAEVRTATAALFPRLLLTAEGGFASAALGELVRPGSLVFGLAAGLAAPLFDGGRLRGEIAFGEARFRELAQNYQQAVLVAFVDVENTLTAQRNSIRILNARAIAVGHAQRAYRIAQRQYEQGMADYLTVLAAERALLATRDAEIQAHLEHLTTAVGVFRALGGGWRESAPLVPR